MTFSVLRIIKQDYTKTLFKLYKWYQIAQSVSDYPKPLKCYANSALTQTRVTFIGESVVTKMMGKCKGDFFI